MPRKTIGDRARYLNVDIDRMDPDTARLLRKRLTAVKKELRTGMDNKAFRELLARLLKLEQELGK